MTNGQLSELVELVEQLRAALSRHDVVEVRRLLDVLDGKTPQPNESGDQWVTSQAGTKAA